MHALPVIPVPDEGRSSVYCIQYIPGNIEVKGWTASPVQTDGLSWVKKEAIVDCHSLTYKTPLTTIDPCKSKLL